MALKYSLCNNADFFHLANTYIGLYPSPALSLSNTGKDVS